jgi:NAD+ kinase
MMPPDLFLVRHGESEGNVANDMSRKGDHSAFTEEFKSRHNSLWRLTDKGRWQTEMAKIWIRNNVKIRFNRCYASEFIRAMETAAGLDIPGAYWYRDYYLRERDWGQFDGLSEKEREARFSEEIKRKEKDGFYWAPPGGESKANISLRVDRVLDTLHRECSQMGVIVVCHGELIWTFRVRLERMPQSVYAQLHKSKNEFDKIHNCQIIHYSRRNPKTGELAPHLNWRRSICPWDLSLSRNEWEEVVRPRFTNEDLMAEVNKVKRLIR